MTAIKRRYLLTQSDKTKLQNSNIARHSDYVRKGGDDEIIKEKTVVLSCRVGEFAFRRLVVSAGLIPEGESPEPTGFMPEVVEDRVSLGAKANNARYWASGKKNKPKRIPRGRNGLRNAVEESLLLWLAYKSLGAKSLILLVSRQLYFQRENDFLEIEAKSDKIPTNKRASSRRYCAQEMPGGTYQIDVPLIKLSKTNFEDQLKYLMRLIEMADESIFAYRD